ncbi:conjugative transfer ATPase [Halorhodospira abdelmalekii]|nr:conjugative transfer ATPase [Halorhodospira abdelmalekii]
MNNGFDRGSEAASAHRAIPPSTPRSPKEREYAELYERPESFTDLLPWTDYDAQTQIFLLEHRDSVGVLLELTPASSEARTQAFLEELLENLQTAIADAIPELEHSPWVLQLFVQDEPNLTDLPDRIRDYARQRGGESDFTAIYCHHLDEHLWRISREGGVFTDRMVTGGNWRGQRRRTRLCLYRRGAGGDLTPDEELEQVLGQLRVSLESAGVGVRRCGAKDLYEWLLPWFNPRPSITDGDPRELIRIAPYPGDEALPTGRDFAGLLNFSMPESDHEAGVWRFDGLPHTVVFSQGLRHPPRIGHFTGERRSGENIYALFDKCPEGTILALTVTIAPQDEVGNQIAQVRAASGGKNIESQLALEEATVAQEQMARGNKLFPTQIAFYLRAETDRQLVRERQQLASRLVSNGIQVIAQEAELLPLHNYIRSLPMAYDPRLERYSRRARYVYADHVTALAPFYGRTRGTGHPGMLFYNRGAEPLVFDPLHSADRKKNAHALILGPTGAGKSALLTYLMMQMLAIYRPRIFVIEAGDSFGLLGRYTAAKGLSVNQLSLQPGRDVSLPPFSPAMRLLDQIDADEQHGPEEYAADTDTEAGMVDGDEAIEDEEGGSRDLLGEMELAARIMITGGEPKEDARMTRTDRHTIRSAIIRAARNVRNSDTGRDQVLTEDVAQALREESRAESLTEGRGQRIRDMADAMELFCSGFAGQVFNRPGTAWPEADLTIVDVGIMAREGYEDQLTVTYIGLMNHINDLVEQHQHEGRPTLVLTDEGHIITTNPLLAPFVVKITKMWRKLGAWFWIATQNLEDFPDASKKMLNMMEWWLCLVMPKEEVEQIARFKDLTEEQKALLLSARKEPGKYVEGVVLADQVEALFRNVPPPIALALAQTEKEEKTERARIMREHHCTDVEAAEIVAERIAEAQT